MGKQQNAGEKRATNKNQTLSLGVGLGHHLHCTCLAQPTKLPPSHPIQIPVPNPSLHNRPSFGHPSIPPNPLPFPIPHRPAQGGRQETCQQQRGSETAPPARRSYLIILIICSESGDVHQRVRGRVLAPGDLAGPAGSTVLDRTLFPPLKTETRPDWIHRFLLPQVPLFSGFFLVVVFVVMGRTDQTMARRIWAGGPLGRRSKSDVVI